MSDKKTLAQVQQEKNDSIMDGVGAWTAYYRANPQRLAADFLNMQLKVFQKILIYIMNLMTVMSFFASRGLTINKLWVCSVEIRYEKWANTENAETPTPW